MEPNQIRDLLYALLYNGILKDNSFIIPYFCTQGTHPFFSEKDFEKIMEEVIPQMYEANKPGVYGFESLKNSLGELMFDGKGFLVPVFGTYVNKKSENRMDNAFTEKDGVRIPYYDFSKDTAFAAFVTEVMLNLNNISSWIKMRDAAIVNKVIDYTAEINTDMVGMKLLQEPYLKLMEKHSN